MSSSMQPTTRAAPKRRARGTTDWNRSSPSSRLMELMMDLPWSIVKASSITSESVESIMIGAFTFLVTRSKNLATSANSSRSGSWRQTSRMWAPFRTWRRPISAASSNEPSLMRRRNRLLPRTLVRSPTMAGRTSSSSNRLSMPDTRVSEDSIPGRTGLSDAVSTSSSMCFGTVPQQPPIRLTQPDSTNRPTVSAMASGVSL